MSEDAKIFRFECFSEDETKRLAKKISLMAKKGDAFALYGTLGAGKSVFARAFVQNLTTAEDVPSPTFTLVQTYQAAAFEIYHFDLYRLKSEEEIWELNIEEALTEGVSLIEWPEKMGIYLPRDCFKVCITPLAETHRLVEISVNHQKKQERLEGIDV